MTLFEEAVEEIKRAYSELDHQLGWRLLYTPAATLGPGAQLLFAGLNPGGKHPLPPAPSSEDGNAYRIDTWGPNGQKSSLQLQVCALFERIAVHVPGMDRDVLMDRSLTANFCPFRSPSWDTLPNRARSIGFSRTLWSRLMNGITPSVVICMGTLTAQHFDAVFQQAGWSQVDEVKSPVSWGRVTYSVRHLRRNGRELKAIRLPHLSRYRIVGRSRSEPSIEQLADIIGSSLVSHRE